MFSRIQTTILFLFVVNVILWVTLLCVSFYLVAGRSLERQIESNLKITAGVLASQWDGSLLVLMKPGMEDAPVFQSFLHKLKLLKQRTNVEGIYIVGADRRSIVASEESIQIGRILPKVEILSAELGGAARGNITASRLIEVGSKTYKSAIAPIYSDGRIVAFLIVDMSAGYLADLKSFRNYLVIFTLFALLCCIVSARIFSRTITTPLSEMVRRVEQIGEADYEQPLEKHGADELAALATSIETMRQNILHRDRQMKMMLGGIAHEIRNPLGGMELFAGILERESLNEEQKKYIGKIQSEISNLKILLNEFLEFAKPQKLNYENISLSALMQEMQSVIHADLQQKQGRWQHQIAPGIDCISADRFKLKQALLNLYRNAYQAMPPAATVSSQIRKNGAGYIIEITNALAKPLDEEAREKLFEPFFTTKEKGIGLGLPLARRIVEAHGGELTLSRHEANAITFAIHLPEHGV